MSIFVLKLPRLHCYLRIWLATDANCKKSKEKMIASFRNWYGYYKITEDFDELFETELEISCEDKPSQMPSRTIRETIEQAKEEEVQYIVSRYLKCHQLNESIKHWFAQHSSEVEEYFKTQNKHVIVQLMGSRRWQLMHYASDIDAAIVTEEDAGTMRNTLSEFYKTHRLYHPIQQHQVTTKAGLELLVMSDFIDPEMGSIKLEYSIQTPVINQFIITETETLLQIKFPTMESKAQYSHTMATLVGLGMKEQILKLGTPDPILKLKAALAVPAESVVQ